MRGVIDAEKYTRIGLIDTLEPHELKQKHQIAGMVRSVTPKISKAGRKIRHSDVGRFYRQHRSVVVVGCL